MSFDPTNPYQAPSPYASYAPPQPPGANGAMILGVISVISSVTGLLGCFCCLFLPLPILGIGLGVAGLFQRPDGTAKILCYVGIVVGILTMLAFVGFMVFAIATGAIEQNQQPFPFK